MSLKKNKPVRAQRILAVLLHRYQDDPDKAIKYLAAYDGSKEFSHSSGYDTNRPDFLHAVTDKLEEEYGLETVIREVAKYAGTSLLCLRYTNRPENSKLYCCWDLWKIQSRILPGDSAKYDREFDELFGEEYE